jgi:hypothetical protein
MPTQPNPTLQEVPTHSLPTEGLSYAEFQAHFAGQQADSIETIALAEAMLGE